MNHQDYEYFDDANEMTPEEQSLVMQVYMKYVEHFVHYIKEVNPGLYRQARDYANDYTQVPGVKIVESDDIPPIVPSDDCSEDDCSEDDCSEDDQ